MTKTVHIHIGPHKTGSTSIQATLRSRSVELAEKLGITVLSDSCISRVAHALKKEDEALAVSQVAEFAKLCDREKGDCIVSCEDLAGDLPGRSRKRRPYPRLWHNINFLMKSLSPHRCVFYFFVREKQSWLKSAYVQNLKHRARFSSFDRFTEAILVDELWSGVLEKSVSKIGDQFVRIPFAEDKDFSAVAALLSRVSGNTDLSYLDLDVVRLNTAPPEKTVRILEQINRSSASKEAKLRAKRSILQPAPGNETRAEDMVFPKWRVRPEKPNWLDEDLSSLWMRVEQRVHQQKQTNLLPDPFARLEELRNRVVVGPDEFPTGGRADMQNQKMILAYRFNGLPETCLLLGLVTSYLRRQTEHTEHAAFLFQRLWEEEYEVLLGTLPTRWLISTFQTFLDHGANEQQRIVGGCAYFFSNLIKAYEAERALVGLKPDAIYPNTSPAFKSGFAGLDRFNLGGTDLLLNTNALLLELSAKDMRIGRVVQEFLVRLKNADTVFSRMDASRKSHGVNVPQFNNCWSFFENPR